MQSVKEADRALGRREPEKAFEILAELVDEIRRADAAKRLYETAILPDYIELADALKRHDQADRAAQQLLNIYAANCEAADPFLLSWLLKDELGQQKLGAPEHVAEIYRAAIKGLELAQPPNARLLGGTRYDFGLLLLQHKKAGEAYAIHSRMLDALEIEIGRADERFGGTIFGLAQRYLDARAFEETEKLMRQLILVVEDPAAKMPSGRIAQTYGALGQLYVEMKQVEQAEGAFTRALKIATAAKESEPDAHRTAVRSLEEF